MNVWRMRKLSGAKHKQELLLSNKTKNKKHKLKKKWREKKDFW